jgi:hypothetical protein
MEAAPRRNSRVAHRSGISPRCSPSACVPGQAHKRSSGFYVEPTVFADVTPDMRIAREEVFGPFTVIMPFDSEEQALRIANDSPYGLASSHVLLLCLHLWRSVKVRTLPVWAAICQLLRYAGA